MMLYTAAKLVTGVTAKRKPAPIRWRTQSTRSVEKKRSAIKPTKNGEIMDASAVVPNTAPACVPENFSVIVKYVPMVTYQQPQTTKFRNIMMLRRMLTELGIRRGDQALKESDGSANVGFLLGSGRFALDRDGAGIGKLMELANDFRKIDSALADRYFAAELFRIGRI